MKEFWGKSLYSEQLNESESVTVMPRFEVASDGEAVQSEGYTKLTKQLGRGTLEGMRLVVSPEADPFKDMADEVKERIIGQDAAVDEVIDTLSRSELRDPDRPVGTFLFMGPTGVGKTELSKEINRVIHKDKPMDILRVDCSDYSSGHAVARLTGSPPGYVGHGKQKPVLSPEAVEGENKIILFDEIEEAAPSLHSLMLQIMEEGELQLNNGTTVSFRDSIIIMTSNVGAEGMQRELNKGRIGFGGGDDKPVDQDTLKRTVMSAAEKVFLPEFLGRIDQRVVFQPHNDAQLAQVLGSHVERSNERFYGKGLILSVTEDLQRKFVETVEDRRTLGARNVVKEFDRQIVGPIAKYLKLGQIERGSHVHAYLDEEGESGELSFGFLVEPHEGTRRAYERSQVYTNFDPGESSNTAIAKRRRADIQRRSA